MLREYVADGDLVTSADLHAGPQPPCAMVLMPMRVTTRTDQPSWTPRPAPRAPGTQDAKRAQVAAPEPQDIARHLLSIDTRGDIVMMGLDPLAHFKQFSNLIGTVSGPAAVDLHDTWSSPFVPGAPILFSPPRHENRYSIHSAQRPRSTLVPRMFA